MGKQTKKTNVDGMIGISQRFAVLNRLITRDLNNNTSAPTFSLYSKDNITEYLTNPYTYEKQLRKAVTYIYGASSHFRRLIQYFTGLSDFAYVVSPYRIDPKSVNVKSVNRNYRKVLNAMSAMNVRSQFPKILTVCLREDTFYGTLWVTNDNITIQQLPSDYCGISTIEGNVLNVTFDFSYFDAHSQYLEYYPTEFQQKYKVYQSNRRARWQELDSPTSFAIKCNNDILDYSIPPFAGILREVYDLEDYKQLKLTKTTLENYAMLVMTLGINEDGMKEVLSIVVGENESSKYWLSVLNSLKNRGVQDILILCSDGLTGIKDAISTAFPKTEQQRCIVHMVRNTLKYVANKDMKAFAKDLKTIYTAADEETARRQLKTVTEKWSGQYPSAMNRWHDNWDAISPIFKFSKDVRTAFYTTNAIESLNSCYRRLNKQRSVFPSSQALMKALYLGTFEIAKKWTMPIRNWGKVRGELEIMYPERMTI